jgi:hypothetical protein
MPRALRNAQQLTLILNLLFEKGYQYHSNMFTIRNSHLSVQILDPIADRRYLGSRYCTGGYIYQIMDAAGNDLLAGPRFGEAAFVVFDGQGAPEVFVKAPGEASAGVGEDVLVIGVGRVRRTSAKAPFHVRNNPLVSEFAAWSVDRSEETVVMKTVQGFGEVKLALTRTVSLRERAVVSQTRLENCGSAVVPVRWFAHPFFPLTESGETCALPYPLSMPANPGYYVNPEGAIVMKRDYPWERGVFQKLAGCGNAASLTIRQRHPVTGEIRAECGFTPCDCAVWANDHAFSFEAFYEKEILPGEAGEWGMVYLI